MPDLIVAAKVQGPILLGDEGLSVWGGVDPLSSRIIDALYAHYAPGLNIHAVRYGSLAYCAFTTQSGMAFTNTLPWIAAAPALVGH